MSSNSKDDRDEKEEDNKLEELKRKSNNLSHYLLNKFKSLRKKML